MLQQKTANRNKIVNIPPEKKTPLQRGRGRPPTASHALRLYVFCPIDGGYYAAKFHKRTLVSAVGEVGEGLDVIMILSGERHKMSFNAKVLKARLKRAGFPRVVTISARDEVKFLEDMKRKKEIRRRNRDLPDFWVPPSIEDVG